MNIQGVCTRVKNQQFSFQQRQQLQQQQQRRQKREMVCESERQRRNCTHMLRDEKKASKLLQPVMLSFLVLLIFHFSGRGDLSKEPEKR